ncbi:MAG: CIA30 family protein [Cyanobacteria bacterium P01_A01_bin.123]
MAQNPTPQWKLERFIDTLNFFGEVPFFGSIRWIQTMFGQSPTPPSTLVPDYSAIAVVLVIGALTPVGQQVIKQLQDRGIAVRSLVPHLPNARSILGEEPALITGDSQNPASLSTYQLQQLMQGVGAIVYCGDGATVASLDQWQSALNAGLADRAVITHTLFDFIQAQAGSQTQLVWGALDDVVMGGVSTSGLQKRGNQTRFCGEVSTANSGGFASVRTRNFDPPFKLSQWAGIQLEARGDGNRYKFILRDNEGWDSPAYCQSFDTAIDNWQTLMLPFDQFVPTFRAKTIPNAPPLRPAHIYSFQLMLSKFEYDRQLNPNFSAGPFNLDLKSIGIYRSLERLPWVTIGAAAEAVALLNPDRFITHGLNPVGLTVENQAQRCTQHVIDSLNS